MIEISCAIVVGVVTYMVASEGIWGAAQTFLSTLLSAILAMNFFEPFAVQLQAFGLGYYSDFVALIGLFTGFVFALRMGSEQLAPSYIQVIASIDSFGRWVFGAFTGYLTMAFLLTSLHTAPLPREFIGFRPENKNFFGFAPDRQWLGFVQYLSERSLRWSPVNPKVFDGQKLKVGDAAKPYKYLNSYGTEVIMDHWPSFPIRYATRRDRLSSNQTASTVVAEPVIPPGAASAPSGPAANQAPPAF